MSRQNPRSEGVPRGYKAPQPLSGASIERLAEYENLLRKWAPKLDLVAPRDLDRLAARHIDDSLKAVSLIDSLSPGPAVDVGSGGGLPGVPLAIVARPRPWLLLEPRQRRAAFLEEVVRELRLEAEVVTLSAEESAGHPRLTDHAIAVARALASPERAFRLMIPLVRVGGTAVLWVGEKAELPPEAALSGPGLATMNRT